MAGITQKNNVFVLGSSGSIGTQTLDIIDGHRDQFNVLGLAAQRNVDLVLDQCLRFMPRYVYMADPQAGDRLASMLSSKGSQTKVITTESELCQLLHEAELDTVVSAIVGAQGLRPTLEAASAGKRILLANKEALVIAGELFTSIAKRHGSQVIPVDSEHNAIYQCLPSDQKAEIDPGTISRLTLTASGGPFRHLTSEQLHHVTPEQAVNHPNWNMGAKVSVDSASMMNKGLEVIEAHWLFACPLEQIHVLVHPQSIIHSLVDYVDGSTLAQMAWPDMKVPIAHALGLPERLTLNREPLDLAKTGTLSFEPPEYTRFPCLQYAYDALKINGSAPAVLNAANEIAVEAFLRGRIRFTEIANIIHHALNSYSHSHLSVLDEVFEADRRAREIAYNAV